MEVKTIFALACVLAATYSASVENFNIYDDDGSAFEEFMEMIMRPSVPERYLPDEYFRHRGLNPKRRLEAFSFKNCGDPNSETFKVEQLKITPDPIKLPGEIGISFSLQNEDPEGSPIPADVVLKKKFLGLWIEIPCVENVGSCSYPDVCELLTLIQCPPVFKENDIPCSCPIEAGNFTLPETKFQIDLSDLPTGDYSAQATLTFPSGSSSCYEVQITLG